VVSFAVTSAVPRLDLPRWLRLFGTFGVWRQSGCLTTGGVSWTMDPAVLGEDPRLSNQGINTIRVNDDAQPGLCRTTCAVCCSIQRYSAHTLEAAWT
jgi:hypothetical protein